MLPSGLGMCPKVCPTAHPWPTGVRAARIGPNLHQQAAVAKMGTPAGPNGWATRPGND